MGRYLTTYDIESDKIEAFTKSDDYKSAIDNADEWVWQYAESAKQAIEQHVNKHDEWALNPNKSTY